MKKQFLLLSVLTMALIPFQYANAETFTYTVNVEQPTIAVSIVSTVPEYSQNLALNRQNPVIFLDKIVVQNTGSVATVIEGKVSTTRTDGGTPLIMASSPSDVTRIVPAIYVPNTDNYLNGTLTSSLLSASNKDLFELSPSQSKEFDLKIKVHADFSAAFELKADINARAK